MSLWDYKILDLIVKEGNLRKAAESMHLTPAAVSHSLAKLEKEFGLPLFVRGRRSMELTQYGKMLLPHIRAQYWTRTCACTQNFSVSKVI